MGVVTIEGSAYFFLIVAESGRLVCLICVSIAGCSTVGGNTAIYRNFLAQKHYCAAAVGTAVFSAVPESNSVAKICCRFALSCLAKALTSA